MPVAEKIVTAKWICRHCGHRWVARVSDPKQCPLCHKRHP